VGAAAERGEALLALGNAAVQEGKLDLALASFRKVLEDLDPDSPAAGDLHLRIGETCRRKGDTEAAVASLTRASELLPDQPVVLGTLALALDGCGRKEEAARVYRATLRLDPDNAIAMNNLAFLLAERDEALDEALGLARRAGELMPEDADIIDTAGWIQWKRKQTDGAIALFAEAVSRVPGDEGYRQHLLLALGGRDGRGAEMEELKSLLEAEVSTESTGKVLELLEAVRVSRHQE
jgi:Flp pilus assembly protein TadD